MKTISIVSGCYNEEGNLDELYARCRAVLKKFPQYDYEFILEDNCSTDGTRDVLRRLAAADSRFRVILNSANFGHIRSPFNALMNARGDAVVWMCSDLQEPPEVIETFVRKWEEGYKVVAGVRSGTHASWLMERFRALYYWMLAKFDEGGHGNGVIPKFTGFGLYDKKVVEALRSFRDPYPYVRGLVSEVGFRRAEVPFVQDRRKSGVTHNNILTLYDMAMAGFTNHTKIPLRLAAICGFVLAGLSMLAALAYFVYKLIYWDTFSLGMAPVVIGLFFFSSIQLIFIGIIGEYLGAVWTQVKNKPLVIEEERLNFD